jgi:hypothetical protein
LPLLKVWLGVPVSLLFLRISFPGLVRLLAGASVGPLARIGVRCFFAHDFTSAKTKLRRPKGFLIPERFTRDGFESRLRSLELSMRRNCRISSIDMTKSIAPSSIIAAAPGMIKKLKGRPKLGNKPTLIRLSDETRVRLRRLIGDRGMAAFIREAVKRELTLRKQNKGK